MNSRLCRWWGLPLALLACAPADAQTQTAVADTLVGRVIGGEEVQELIGHVLLTDGNVRVTCDRALRSIRTGKSVLTGDVVVTDDSLVLHAPRGIYDREERVAEAFDRVRVDDGHTQLTAGYGKYFAGDRRAFFHTNVVVVDSESVITADTLTYWRTTRRSLAVGNVRVYNGADRVTIYGGRLDHDADRQYSRMTLRPVLLQTDSSGGRLDTLQVRGLVLEAYRDSMRRLIATDSVEVVRSDLAAAGRYACFYPGGDSIHLRTNPVIWYRETQVTGDSINVYLTQRKLDRMAVLGDAFAISRNDSLHPGRFDQITGDRLAMQFGDEGLRRMDVDGRAISLYHLYDDTLANGLNKTSGDRIVMLFAGGKAETITVYGGVEGQYFPENMVKSREREYALPGFALRSGRPRHIPLPPFNPAGAN